MFIYGGREQKPQDPSPPFARSEDPNKAVYNIVRWIRLFSAFKPVDIGLINICQLSQLAKGQASFISKPSNIAPKPNKHIIRSIFTGSSQCLLDRIYECALDHWLLEKSRGRLVSCASV